MAGTPALWVTGADMLKVYLFNRLPGVWPKWTLAVWSTGLADARQHIKAHYHGGYLAGQANPGEKIKADCGAATDAAQVVMHEEHERWINGGGRGGELPSPHDRQETGR